MNIATFIDSLIAVSSILPIMWLIFSFVVATIAVIKNRSWFGFFLLSVFFSPLIGLIAVLIISSIVPPVRLTKYNSKICPACAETVKLAAVLCKHCGTNLAKPVDVAA